MCNFHYVRYCDDFVVFCNGTKAQALAMKEELKNVLAQMGLTLSEEKTKVTHITCIPHIVVRVCVAAIVKTYHLATLAL